jgi:hypothetical protein
VRNRREHTGYALVGTMIFLLVATIMWLSVTRQIGTHLRMEKNNQSLQLYNDTALRALSWGLALMETGLPPSNPYACKMLIGRDELQMFVVEIRRNASLRYTLTARPAVSGDELLPDAPYSFMSLPGQATAPNPPNGATDISLTPILSWTAGSGATSHDVYFGTISPPTFQGNQTDITFNPGVLLPNTTYYWRIDERNAAGATTGVPWSFTTGAAPLPLPGQATNPDPAHTATGISLTAILSWTAGSDAASHDVYFGTSSPGTFQGNQAGMTFNPGALLSDTTYYWRIDEINASGTTTGVVWRFTTSSVPLPPPGQATNPNPADGARGVSRSTTLNWTAGSDAASHDVYFGTSNPPTFQGNQSGTTFNPGFILSRNTWYYWRIDEVNASGTTTGVVWSFRTGTGSTPPGQATNPNPSDGAADISLTAILSWTAGSDAASHDVYFGTSSPGAFRGNQSGTTFDPGILLPNTTYYWRIDEINAAGTTTGVVWRFTTGSASLPPPGQATNPDPAHTATGISLTAILSWTAGSDAASHDVYFGTSSPGTFQGNQAGTTFNPGTLLSDTTYYWRIDEINASGTTTGVVWRFTTSSAPLPPPGQATNPTPSTVAINVSLTQDLSWTAGSGATTRDVYFGTVNPPVTKVIADGTALTYDTGTMTTSTTYYWRVDEKNAGGTTTGTVWSFTTVPPPPGQATNPTPADGVRGVSRSTIISWTAGAGAASHDVYFGTTNPPTFQGNQTGTTFDPPGTLARRTWYYWRIDEVNVSGTTTGVVWSFRTGNN